MQPAHADALHATTASRFLVAHAFSIFRALCVRDETSQSRSEKSFASHARNIGPIQSYFRAVTFSPRRQKGFGARRSRRANPLCSCVLVIFIVAIRQ